MCSVNSRDPPAPPRDGDTFSRGTKAGVGEQDSRQGHSCLLKFLSCLLGCTAVPKSQVPRVLVDGTFPALSHPMHSTGKGLGTTHKCEYNAHAHIDAHAPPAPTDTFTPSIGTPIHTHIPTNAFTPPHSIHERDTHTFTPTLTHSCTSIHTLTPHIHTYTHT